MFQNFLVKKCQSPILDGLIFIDSIVSYTTLEVSEDGDIDFGATKADKDAGELYEDTIRELKQLNDSFVYPDIIQRALQLDLKMKDRVRRFGVNELIEYL